MSTERIQRRIERLLDQIEQEADHQNWQRVRDLAGEVLEFAPDNADATTLFAVAERRLTTASEPITPISSNQVVEAAQPTSFADGRYEVKRFLGALALAVSLRDRHSYSRGAHRRESGARGDLRVRGS